MLDAARRSARSTSLVGTHALFQDDVAFRDLGARRRRRAASLRRAPAPGARAQGRGRRHAGDDRDADPAHAGAHLFRRHGRLGAAREAGRPPADRHPHRPARPARRGGRGRRPRARRGPARLLGLPAGRGIREQRPRRRRGALRRRCKQRFGDAVGLVHGQHEGRREGRAPWRASPRARRGSWSPPR